MVDSTQGHFDLKPQNCQSLENGLLFEYTAVNSWDIILDQKSGNKKLVWRQSFSLSELWVGSVFMLVRVIVLNDLILCESETNLLGSTRQGWIEGVCERWVSRWKLCQRVKTFVSEHSVVVMFHGCNYILSNKPSCGGNCIKTCAKPSRCIVYKVWKEFSAE